MPGERIPVVFDTDGGVDDCTALWWALESPDLEILAVTTVRGVVSAAQAARNAAKVLHAAGRTDVPIAVGADEPLGPVPDLPSPRVVHGEDGLGEPTMPDVPLAPVAEPAAELLNRVFSERPGEIALVAVGPATNVAQVLRRNPGFAKDVRSLHYMGGVVHPPGNALPLGEFNVVTDPTAADEMVRASWSRRPVIVPLDATHRATMSEAERALLDERRTAAARFLAPPIGFYWRIAALQTVDRGCPAHDALTIMSVAHPEILRTTDMPLAVDLGGGAAWGTTVADLRVRLLDELPAELVDMARAVLFGQSPIWSIALDADVTEFRARMRALFGG